MADTRFIKNVCLLGHGGNGKTSLAEAMLYIAKETDRLGKVTEGNTVSDCDAEEIKRKFSISTSVAPLTWKDCKINIIDTPGFMDFEGEVLQGLRVAGTALIVMDAKSGADSGSKLAWEYATKCRVPKAFFVNKMDDENADFGNTIELMRERFGHSVCPIEIPVIVNRQLYGYVDLLTLKGWQYTQDLSLKSMEIPSESMEKVNHFRDLLVESIAETSEEMFEKYCAGEEFSLEEMQVALNKGIISGSIAPVMVGSAAKATGVISLLDIIASTFPNPLDRFGERDADGNQVKPDPDADPSVFIFKTVSDPFVGKMSYFKVMSGTLKKDASLINHTNGTQEKFAHIYTIKGKKQTEVNELVCGDIGVTSKLAAAGTNDTLGGKIKYAPTEYPNPYCRMAIQPSAKGDEDKISQGIARIIEEDKTLKYENNRETKQMTIAGMGDMHLDIVVSKLKSRYGVSVDLTEARIPYRETIKKTVQVEGKHKKQSGGSGQYGHVKITFSPGFEEGLTFTQSVVGGAVPKGYYPAVEKGLLDAMQRGVLAGYPVVSLAADLYDGSYHDVDSNEISFKLAAQLAYNEGLPKAGPVLLEPVVALKVSAPECMIGDVMGDLNKRRSRVLGMNPDEEREGCTVIDAEVPLSEMSNYVISLRALTQGRAKFDYEFVRYEEVPGSHSQKIIEQGRKLNGLDK